MGLILFEYSAEDMLYASITAKQQMSSGDAEKQENVQFLHCKFFQIGVMPDREKIQEVLAGCVGENDISLYFCSDGDLIVSWLGEFGSLGQAIMEEIAIEYETAISSVINIEEFFEIFQWIEGVGKLKSECFKKQKKPTKHGKQLAKYFQNEQLISTLQKTIKLTLMQRALRSKLNILIVEDQKFSQKILKSILKDYDCHVAESSGEALLLYMEKCPDIVFLDIELPDISGHNFAGLLNRIDPDAYIVIVTSNQYESDIKKAQENNVKGFIAKPYEKEVILKSIQNYKKFKKRR